MEDKDQLRELNEVIAHLEDYDGDYENAEKLGRVRARVAALEKELAASELGRAGARADTTCAQQRVAALETALRNQLREAFEAGMHALSESETDDRDFYDQDTWTQLVDERYQKWLAERDHQL